MFAPSALPNLAIDKPLLRSDLRHRAALANNALNDRWTALDDGDTLFRCAAEARSGCILQISGGEDLSTLALCAGSCAGAKLPVYAINPLGGAADRAGPGAAQQGAALFRNFVESDLVRYVRLVNMTSAVAALSWREPISLLVIDGGCAEASACADFAHWRPHLRPGAIVAVRDPFGRAAASIELLVAHGALRLLERLSALSLFRYTGRGLPSASQPIAIGREGSRDSRYALRIDKIGYSTYYGGGGAYLYQPVPKCACTTIKTLLIEMEGLVVDENVWRRHQKEYNQFPGVSHLALREQLDIFQGRTNTFKFAIVRNPYARLASAYSDKILLNPATYLLRKIQKSAAEQGVALSNPMTFDQFVRVVSCQPLGEMDPHCRPQYYEGRFGVIKFDFVGRMEALPSDLVFAFEQIGAPDSIIQRVNERHNPAGSSCQIWNTVMPETRRLFHATFEIDFDTLQYPRRLPNALGKGFP